MLKPSIKAQISGKMHGISDIAIASVHSEKTHLKKMIMIITKKKLLLNEKKEMCSDG